MNTTKEIFQCEVLLGQRQCRIYFDIEAYTPLDTKEELKINDDKIK